MYFPMLRRLATMLSIILLFPPIATAETTVSARGATAIASHHPMSIEDVLRVESLAAAEADPTGHWLVYERLRPYAASDDFSFRNYAQGKSGHQLWIYDLKGGGEPRLLPGLDPKPHSYLEGFSASGRYLAVMSYRFGALTLGAYDISAQRFVSFPETPAFSREGLHNPTWISDGEMVFAALPDGQSPEMTSVRTQTARILAQAWSDAWRGHVVTASEVRAPAADATDRIETGRLIRADVRTGRTRVMAEGLYADLRVSPNRRLLAALAMSQTGPTDPNKPAEEDTRHYRLEVFDLLTNGRRNYTSDLWVSPYSIVWSPDGARLAVFAWQKGQTAQDGRYRVVDIATGAVTVYEHQGLDLADERERGYFRRPERAAFLGRDLAIFGRAIPAGEDQTARFTPQNIRPQDAARADWFALSADGTRRNLTSDLPNPYSRLIHTGDRHVTISADDGVYRLFADGTRRKLSPDLSGHFRYQEPGTFATRAGAYRPDFGDEALFTVADAQSAHVVMIDLRDGHEGQSRLVTAPSLTATPLAGSLAAGAVAFRAETGAMSKVLVARADSRPPEEIARINAPLAQIDFGTWKMVTYGVDGPTGKGSRRTIESCVLLPPGFKPGDPPPPLVVEVYPDTRPRCQDGGPIFPYGANTTSPYLWSGRGYAYAQISAPRSLIWNHLGPIAGMPPTIDAGIDALVEQGLADPARLALFGQSQGGFSSLFTAAHLHRFKAVIALNSWADLFSHYFGTNGVYSSVYGRYFGNFARYDTVAGSDFGIGRTPFDDPDVYIRNSPVFLAPKITAPVLLVHSDMDAFSMSQFDEMYGALTRAGKDVRYVRYWGEGHSPSSPANIRDLWRRFDAFLAETGVAPTVAERQRTNAKTSSTTRTSP